MGQKRLTRAQAQHGIDLELDQIQQCHSYADRVQAQVRAELGSMSIPPQQEGDILENDERMNEYYKEMSEILKAKAAKEAEKGMALADDFKSAERTAFMMRDELEILKLKKTDPELDDRQRRMLSDIKAKLLEYPALLVEVTGNETFMQAIKKSYESKLEEYETTLKGLIRDVFELPMTCSSKVSTLLTDFAETTLKPAINIVKLQHEQLETELGEANERSIRLEKQIEDLEADAERASGEIRDLTLRNHSREQSLMDDIAALQNKLETNEEAYRIQKETHQRETMNLVAQLEKARTNAATEAKLSEQEIESYRAAAKALEKGKEDLEKSVKRWQERFTVRRQEHDKLKVDYESNEAKLKSAEEQVFSLEENLRTEIDAVKAVKKKAELEIRPLQKKVEEWEAGAKKMTEKHKTLKDEFKALQASSDKAILSLQGQLSTEKTEKESLQQSHEGEIQRVQGQLSRTMTASDSLRQSLAREAQKFQGELSTVNAEKKSLQRSHEGEIQNVKSQLSAAKMEKESLERSFHSQLSSVKSDGELLKQSLEAKVESLQAQLSTVESEKVSLMQTREKESQSFQTQLLSSKSDNDSLRHSMEKEMQSLRDQLSKANDANESLRGQLSTTDDTNKSLVKSKQELEAKYCGATESSESRSRLLELHISILDSYDLEGAESEDVLVEMEKLFGMTERYTGSTTETVSMPKYIPQMTLVGKATELPEPNLAAARRLWISSRCGSLALDVAQAFFMQREISSTQFALLPWIHAALNRAVTTMCEKSTLTPDLAISSVWILQGLVYTATVAREWSSVWNPKIEEMLAQMTHWLGEHVSDGASVLMMIVGQVNEMVTTHESPSTSMSPNDISQSRRIDSENSDIPDGMAMVVDISGIFILFTADNAFIFGANEVRVLELNIAGSMVIKFDQTVIGLPATLMELQLLDLHSPDEVSNRHEALLKPVLTKDRCEIINPFKRRRMRG